MTGMTITAAADGSALGNPGPSGWAWYVDDEHWAAGGWEHGTNNMGELMAVLELFRATAHLDDDLLVLCDSQYAINSITKWMPGWKAKGWRKGDGKPVMNLDILQQLDEAIRGRRYRFEWVKGHVGHVLNEAADARARAAAESYQRGAPTPTGPGWSGAPALPAAEAAAVAEAEAEASESGRSEAAARPAGPAGPISTASESDDDDTAAVLFELDEPVLHEVTVLLTDEEHARLAQRARQAGTSPEGLLRSLV
jgi:ribonuclease HI